MPNSRQNPATLGGKRLGLDLAYAFQAQTNEIIDARLEGDTIRFLLANGQSISLPASREYIDLYWEVKLRNRRRAFGLE